MVSRKPTSDRLFNVTEANRTLPLVSRIVRDIVRAFAEFEQHRGRLGELRAERKGSELDVVRSHCQRLEDEIHDLMDELESVGCQLKDFHLGLVDFPAKLDGRDVYLCWKLDEPEVSHWHEVSDGFSGRRPVEEHFAE